MKRMMLVLVVGALLMPGAGYAQNAVVLSGGGSRGIAHAGVLLVLEQRGYDPDLVVGTSMGAVVGALYAAGYAPEEIVDQLTHVEWRSMFEPTPIVAGPERAVRYPMLTVDLALTGLRFSRGLVGQWRINRALAQLLFEANARSRGDFDELPRRYRAVAADLQTGEAVALDHGDLALAVRASMSVPGFFAPIEWEDRVLVDGGIAAYLPTAIARGLGADYIVAVDVSRPADSLYAVAPLDVVQRALDWMQVNTQTDSIPPDVLVLPDIKPGVTGANFPDDPRPLIEIGRKTAERTIPQNLPSSQRTSADRRPLPDALAALVIEAPDSALAALTRRFFSDAVPGAFDARAINTAMDAVYATGLVEGVWPRVVNRPEDGAAILIVRVIGQPKVALSAAANYENDRGGRAWALLDRNGSLVGRPAVYSAAAQIGELLRNASLSLRVYASRVPGAAWSLGTFGSEESVRAFSDDEISTQDVVRAGGWIGFERSDILRERVALAAVRAEWIDVEDGASGLAIGPTLRWGAIPTTTQIVGVPFNIEAETRWGDIKYSRVALSGSRAMPAGAFRLAAVADVRAASSGAPIDVRPSLGDDGMMPGLRWGERRGRARVAAGIDAAYPLLGGFARVRARSGTIANELSGLDTSTWTHGVQLGVVFTTPLGALEAGYGIATRGGGRFDVRIGQRF